MIGWIAGAAFAGAWTKEAGQYYAKAGVDVYDAFDYVAAGDAQAQGGSYLGQQYHLYAEAGVVPGYGGQLSLALPLDVGTHGSRSDPAPCGSGPIRATSVRAGDVTAAAQVALSRKRPIAVALQAKVPAYANGDVGRDYPACGELFPKPGDGQVDLTAWLVAGATPIRNGFTEGALGFVERTDAFVGWSREERTGPGVGNRITTVGYVNGVAFGVKYGQKLGQVLPIVAVDGVVNLNRDPIASQFTREYLTLSGSALVDVAEGLAIEPRLATELWSNNGSKGLAAGLGVSYRR